MSGGKQLVRHNQGVATSSDIYINYLLDRTGSMAPIWEATIEGFNGYKNEQARQPGTAHITLTAFDSPTHFAKPDIRIVFDAPAKDIPDLESYATIAPRGATPLLDAVGIVIENTDDWLASHHFSGKVLIVINTDGEENSSTEFSLDAVKARIKQKRDEGWEFVFMGAGIDAFAEAGEFGIPQASTMSYGHTPRATTDAHSHLSASTSSYRDGQQAFGWKDPKKS